MRCDGIKRQSCKLCSLIIVIAAFGRSALADDAQLRSSLLRLASNDRKERREVIEQLAASKDGRVADFLRAFNEGNIYLWKSPSGAQTVRCDKMINAQGGKQAPLADPISGEPLLIDGKPAIVQAKQLEDIGPAGPERRLVADAIVLLSFWSPDDEQRLSALQKAGSSANPKVIPALEEVANSDSPEKMRRSAHESIDIIRLTGADMKVEDRQKAADDLAAMRSLRGEAAIQDVLDQFDSDAKEGQRGDADYRAQLQRDLDEIERYQSLVRGLGYVRDGLSLGSILILMALGLSIIFGLMGVINMAHGELMMIGAYTTYAMQLIFQGCINRGYIPARMVDWFFVISLPAAFLIAALCGYLIEKIVVRFLYGRPLDTLVATFGVSLVMIQAVKSTFGYNIGVRNPTWLRGGFEVIQDLVLPYNRCFIVVLTAICVGVIYCLLKLTPLGLRIRATMQNREMASALGVNTGRIDGYTFALGAGLAGVAGYALTLIGGVTPDMGQNYIVDSFLVVVTGGVGELSGAIWAGLGMGMLDKWFEPFTGAVWGRVLLLILVILFIQRRPQGLFPPKGRLADV